PRCHGGRELAPPGGVLRGARGLADPGRRRAGRARRLDLVADASVRHRSRRRMTSQTTDDADRLRRAYNLHRFIDHLRFERGVSDRTLEAYDHDVTRLAVFLSARGRSEPGDATTADLRAFVLRLKELGLAPSSIARNVSAVRTYFGFLLAEGLIAADPS